MSKACGQLYPFLSPNAGRPGRADSPQPQGFFKMQRHLIHRKLRIIPYSTVGHCWEFSSVAQLCDFLWSHGLQHAWPPCLLPTPRACSNSCPSSQCEEGIHRPGLHLRPVRAGLAWPSLQWTLNSVLSTYGSDNGRIRPPLGRGILKITSRLLTA